jgi:hypothetical protein
MEWADILPQFAKEIPLDPPLIKGEVGVFPFNKRQTEGIS